MVSDSISILYDHYKDTCAVTSRAVGYRDRAMLFAITALSFFAFQTLSPNIVNHTVTDYLSFKFGLTFQVDLSIIGNVTWVLVLLFSLRYFQTAVFVERQYHYLHALEDRLNSALGQPIITREGKTYLADYPLFSNWMSFLYTIAFPLLLFLVAYMKIIWEWLRASGEHVSLGLILNSLFAVLLTVSIGLYVIVLHSKKQKG